MPAERKVAGGGVAQTRRLLREALEEAREQKATADERGARMTAAYAVGKITAYEHALGLLHSPLTPNHKEKEMRARHPQGGMRRD